MPKVFAVQDSPGKNILSASDYGEVEILLPARAQIMFTPQPVVRELRHKLRNYKPEDYILAIGDPSAIGVACSIAASKTGGRFKMLKWDRDERRYYAVDLDVFDRNKGES